MSWSVLQSNSFTQTTTASTWSVTYTSNVSSGTVLLFAVGQSNAATINSVKDGSNNSFTQIGLVNLNNSSAHGACALYALATPAGDVGTKPTITITFSAATVLGSIWIGEVSGIQAVTDGSAATAFGAAGGCTPTYSDTAANELFVAVFADDGGPETSSVTGGWTVDSKSINNNADANIVVAYGNSVNGSETNAWTSTGTTTACGAIAISFKLTASGPTTAQPLIVTTSLRQPPAPPPATPRLAPLSPTTPYLTDYGTGSDALSITVPLIDSGTGADSLAVTPWIPQPFTVRLVPPPVPAIPPWLAPLPPVTPVSLTDAGTGSDALSIAVAFTDPGAGSDALSSVLTAFLPALLATPPPPPPGPPPIVPRVVPLVAGAPVSINLADAGTGSDTIAVAVTLSDAGTGADTLAVFFLSPLILAPVQPTPVVPPIAPQVLSLATAVLVPLSDAGTGSDTLAIAIQPTDSGTGSDTLVLALAVTDSGSGADTLVLATTLADTGTGSDSITLATSLTDVGSAVDTITIALAFADPGSAGDVLTVTAAVPLGDVGNGADTIVIAFGVVDTGAGADALSLPPSGNTGTVTWRAGALPGRWQVASQRPRWVAKPASPRWKAVLMAGFTPIAAISLQEVNVLWTSDLAGTVIDPTVTPLVVQMAFPVSSGNVNAPAQPVTWYTASWLAGGTSKGWVAQCLVGPGGVVTLVAGQSYDVWSKIQGNPEIPATFTGVQQVY